MMTTVPPKTKEAFYQDYLKGRFGNKPQVWATWA